jgi:hypothetical protein
MNPIDISQVPSPDEVAGQALTQLHSAAQSAPSHLADSVRKMAAGAAASHEQVAASVKTAADKARAMQGTLSGRVVQARDEAKNRIKARQPVKQAPAVPAPPDAALGQRLRAQLLQRFAPRTPPPPANEVTHEAWQDW